MADIDGQFEVDGLVKQREELERLMMSNPEMEKRVQGLIRKVLMGVRKAVADQAKGAMNSDPRQSYKAVRTAVYRQILGGSVNILQKRRGSTQFSSYEPPRKQRPAWARGGNRIPRSQRTNDLIHYVGPDRSFVLRFLNAGTGQRQSRYGNRGNIRARNFFANSSHSAMRKAADELTQLIDQLIKQEIK